MLKRILVSLLAYLMAFYPIFGSLANAGTKENSAQHSAASNQGGANTIDEASKVKLQETYGKLPLSFIQNNGQVDEKVKYYEKGSGHATFFTNEGVYLTLVRSQKIEGTVPDLRTERSGVPSLVIARDGFPKQSQPFGAGSESGLTPAEKLETPNLQSEIVKLVPLNSNKDTEIIAEDLQEGKVNYFIGNDPNKWKTNIPTYGAVVYKEIYKGIDMKFYGNNKQMEYDIIVKPGADPNMVKLSYEGIEGLKVTDNGDLLISLKQGEIIQKKPYIYQEINGKRVEVDGRFEISSSPLAGEGRGEGSFAYGFRVASYNKNHPLIIDPVLVYSTYLGGHGIDFGKGIAVDTSGNAYITGYTDSTDFPTTSPIQGTYGGGISGDGDIFVTKINASGTGLAYSTYLGGSGQDVGISIAVDSSGNGYITGWTCSADFPIASALYGNIAGACDAFVTKINAASTSLTYSTYLGGSNFDGGRDIAVAASGNAYITGYTWSIDFPTVSSVQGEHGGGYSDIFITKINSSGNNLVYSTYLGGSGEDDGYGIAVDISENTYVTGDTSSSNFPLVSPLQGVYRGGNDAFITKINTLGTSIIYSTYLGGSSVDKSYDISVDISGNVYISGDTSSTNFPIAAPMDTTLGGGSDVFVTKIDASGYNLVYSTYLGGSSGEWGSGIAIDTSGNVYVTGYTFSTDFPTVSPIQRRCNSCFPNTDAFVTKINASGSSLIYSTFLGGSNPEGYVEGSNAHHGIAVDTSGNAYIVGTTCSTDFPTVFPIQGTYGGGWYDVFVAKIGGGKK